MNLLHTPSEVTVLNARESEILYGACQSKMHSFDFFFFIISSAGSKTFDEVRDCLGSSVFAGGFAFFGSLVEGGGGGGFFNVPTNLYFSGRSRTHQLGFFLQT